MTSKKKDEGAYYITVDEYEDNPETGELMLVSPRMRVQFPYVNDQPYTDKDGVFHAAEARSLTPDTWHGMYSIPANADRRDKMVAVMNAAVKKYPDKIIGPYDTPEEAIQAKHAQRKATPRELVARLGEQVETQNTELEELRAKLAAMEKGR